MSATLVALAFNGRPRLWANIPAMFSVIIRNCWNRLCELGQAPARSSRSSSSNGKPFRSGFQRSVGAVVFMFAYFALSSQSLMGDVSADNSGIFKLLFWAAIAAGLGAFFAPRIAAMMFSFTLSGRRAKAERSKTRSSSSFRSGRSTSGRDYSSAERDDRSRSDGRSESRSASTGKDANGKSHS